MRVLKHRGIIISVVVVLWMLPLLSWSQEDSVVSMSGDLMMGLPSSGRRMDGLADRGKLTDTLRRWEFGVSMGGEFIGNGYGWVSLYGVMPSVVYRPSERLRMRMSLSMLDGYSHTPQGYTVRGNVPRSRAPLRNPNRAAALDVSATYKVNDRLTVGASLMRVGGGLASGMIVNPWHIGDGPVTLDATAFSASMRYRVGNDSYLDVRMTVIDDRTGALWPTLLDPFGSPFQYHGTVFGGNLF